MSNIKASSGDLTIKARNSNNSSIIVTSTGIVQTQTTARPAFIARGCSNTTQANNRTIIFPTVVLNRYGCYNSSTGIFTAPVTGLYHISYHLFLYHTNGARYLTALASDAFYNECTIEVPTVNVGTGYACAGGSLNALLNANETVYVISSGGVIGTNDIYSYFGAVYLGS
jgi:hypothetical protein